MHIECHKNSNKSSQMPILFIKYEREESGKKIKGNLCLQPKISSVFYENIVFLFH